MKPSEMGLHSKVRWEIKDASSLSKVKKSKVSSSSKEDDVVAAVPVSLAWERYVDELQKPVDKGKYKYEDCDPTTGERSCCGVPIPADAPPRPND